MNRLLFLSGMALCAASLHAAVSERPDSAAADTLSLCEVVVTGTRAPKLLKSTPVQTRLITAKDIAKTDATDIQELLAQEIPGVEFSYAMNQQVHMNFGGFGGQSVLFLVDGERLAGETMDDTDFSRIDMNSVERIEKVRGASSALYGSNAGGGVINIIKKESADPFGATIGFRAGKHGQRRYTGTLTAGGSFIQNNLSVTASRMESYDVKNASGPPARVISTIYGHKTLNVEDRLTFRLMDRLRLKAHAGFYMRQLPRDVEVPERYRAYSAGVKGELSITDADRLELSYAFDQYDKSKYRRATGTDTRNYTNVQNSVRALFTHDFARGDALTVGADWMHDYLMNDRLTDSERSRDSYALFAQYDLVPCERLEAVGTLRYDYLNVGDSHASRLTPGVSVRFAPNRRTNIRLAYGAGFKMPSLKEMYSEFDMAGIWIVKGNPRLKPEKSHNVNLSVDYTRGRYNFTATAYYNYVIDRITTGQPYYSAGDNKQLHLDYINLDRFHSVGAELTAQAYWTCGIGARISYAYIHERAVSYRNDSNVAGRYLPARPHSMTVRADWQRSFTKSYDLAVVLSGRALSAVTDREYVNYYDPSQGMRQVRYPAYTVWKLSATQNFSDRVKLTLTLDDLLNYRPKYYFLNAPTTDGISFLAGLTLRI